MNFDNYVNHFIKLKNNLGFFPDLDEDSHFITYKKDSIFYVTKIFKGHYSLTTYDVFECVDLDMTIVYFFLPVKNTFAIYWLEIID